MTSRALICLALLTSFRITTTANNSSGLENITMKSGTTVDTITDRVEEIAHNFIRVTFDNVYNKAIIENNDKNNVSNNNNKKIKDNTSPLPFMINKDRSKEIQFRKWEPINNNNYRKEKFNNDTFKSKGKWYNKNLEEINRKRVRREEEDKCSKFTNIEKDTFHHPGHPNNYYSNIDCILIINATDDESIIELDFRDKFHIESYPNCTYDFLEVRDGSVGYADLLGTFCGDKFPNIIRSQGPNLWLRFKSDATIEYEGFTGVVTFNKSSNSRKPTIACFQEIEEAPAGLVEKSSITAECLSDNKNRIDAVWKIIVKPKWRIFLNFTQFSLAHPNECKKNFVDVFGEQTDMTHRIKNFCGSMADTVESSSNVLHVRFFALSDAIVRTNFSIQYTAFRNRDGPSCDAETEFDCDDATCIDYSLYCNGVANCRLKGDEDPDKCGSGAKKAESLFTEPHIISILVIFSLILSGMSFVLLYNCIRKLVADHKIIKEHIRQSCEDRLDMLAGSKLTLDARLLQGAVRDSLQTDNRRNSEIRRQRHKPSSESDRTNGETHIDIENGSWQEEDEVKAETDSRSVRADAKAKTKEQHKDKKSRPEQEAIRRTERPELEGKDKDRKRLERKDKEARGTVERRGTLERKRTLEKRGTEDITNEEEIEMRNVSVCVPDTKESGCQTRESLFQSGTVVSSDESSVGARGFSTFGYSGSSILPPRPASPPPVLTIQLKPAKTTESHAKKMLDRRPMSAETTRSAPDVIIVSKPLR